MGPLTPQEFYREHVKPLYNIQDKVRDPLNTSQRPCNLLSFTTICSLSLWLAVGIWSVCMKTLYPQVCLVNDPRPQNPYGKLYSVEFLGNMVGGRSTLYNNQPIQLLKKAAAESIKDGEVGGARLNMQVTTLMHVCMCELHKSQHGHCLSLRPCGLVVMSENISTASWALMTWMCEYDSNTMSEWFDIAGIIWILQDVSSWFSKWLKSSKYLQLLWILSAAHLVGIRID